MPVVAAPFEVILLAAAKICMPRLSGGGFEHIFCNIYRRLSI
jgi:hypothetical protein